MRLQSKRGVIRREGNEMQPEEPKEMQQAKRQWHRPVLIVLMRRKPEEAVLQTCKWGSATQSPEPWFYCWNESCRLNVMS